MFASNKLISHTSSESIVITDSDHRIIMVNKAFCDVTGYSFEEVVGLTPSFVKSGLHDQAYYDAMWESIHQNGYWHGEILNKHKNGDIATQHLSISVVRDLGSEAVFYVGIYSAQGHQNSLNEQMAHAAFHDPLTGLPNRLRLAQKLHSAISEANSENQLAIVLLDLDGFKPVNDNYGHSAGDRVLIEVARRLTEAVRGADMVARLGGDEFVVLLTEIKDEQACRTTLERLLKDLCKIYEIGGLKLRLGASLGASLYPRDGSDADTLLRYADAAMYQAKHQGKNRFVIHDPVEAAKRQDAQARIQRLYQALAYKELFLHYQPQVDLHSGNIIGMEALIRWQSQDEGLIMPDKFMPLVETSDLAMDIGQFVLEQAIKQIALWQRQGRKWRMGINISPRHLEHPRFIDDLAEILAQYPDLPSDVIELEIIESAALEDVEKVVEMMKNASNALGIRWALDDFGTGHASLTYLRRLPAQTLKIDRSFVRDITHDVGDLIMVEGMSSLANSFRREAMAEGMESLAAGRLLVQIGCRYAQGFAIARPMPARELELWADQWRPDPAWRHLSLRKWSRDDMPILYATLDHQRWVESMEALVEGKTTVIPELNPCLCRFGRWQQTLGQQRYRDLEEYDALVPIHNAVHDSGRKIVDLLASEDGQSAQDELISLYQLRDKLLLQMDHLASRVTDNVNWS
ncbi:MAG: EAL domain-containing protein [Methylomonas sp.]